MPIKIAEGKSLLWDFRGNELKKKHDCLEVCLWGLWENLTQFNITDFLAKYCLT